MPSKLSDQGTHYFVQVAPYYPGGSPRRLKITRFLCLGGPAAGLLRSGEELSEEGVAAQYRRYNAARRRGVRGCSAFSHVFVHVELLGEKT